MSSTKVRIQIEEYENGGFGISVLKGIGFERMGLSDELDLLQALIVCLNLQKIERLKQ